MVSVVVSLLAKAGSEAALIKLLEGAKAFAAASEPGCAAYEIGRSRADPRRFVVFQRYRSEDALTSHRQTPHAMELGARLPAVLEGPGEVEFFDAID
jgi:quinol monooxygenase YgiN